MQSCPVRILDGPVIEVDCHGYCATARARRLSQHPGPLEHGKKNAGPKGPQAKRPPKMFFPLRHRSARVTIDSPHSQRAGAACYSKHQERSAAKQGLSRGRSSSARKKSQSRICPRPMPTRRDPAPTPACQVPSAECQVLSAKLLQLATALR
jgi:hypothetical protein